MLVKHTIEICHRYRAEVVHNGELRSMYLLIVTEGLHLVYNTV
jgi:hypothetical protein